MERSEGGGRVGAWDLHLLQHLGHCGEPDFLCNRCFSRNERLPIHIELRELEPVIVEVELVLLPGDVCHDGAHGNVDLVDLFLNLAVTQIRSTGTPSASRLACIVMNSSWRRWGLHYLPLDGSDVWCLIRLGLVNVVKDRGHIIGSFRLQARVQGLSV